MCVCVCARECACEKEGSVCVCVCVCVCVVRAGAYLLTAAALAAFSSACCCRTFRLTFHAEIKIADELEKETGATGGEEGEKIRVKVC